MYLCGQLGSWQVDSWQLADGQVGRWTAHLNSLLNVKIKKTGKWSLFRLRFVRPVTWGFIIIFLVGRCCRGWMRPGDDGQFDLLYSFYDHIEN